MSKLRDHREAAGVSQQKLADVVHVSRSCIGSIETGVRHPSVQVAKAIGGYLKFDWEELFEDERGGAFDGQTGE